MYPIVFPPWVVLIWFAIAINPAHCGELALVPPTTYQPLLQGVPEPQKRPVTGGSVEYTRTPLVGEALYATSGIARLVLSGAFPVWLVAAYDASAADCQGWVP